MRVKEWVIFYPTLFDFIKETKLIYVFVSEDYSHHLLFNPRLKNGPNAEIQGSMDVKLVSAILNYLVKT